MTEAMTKANGMELAYEQFGDPSDPPMLLIMGLASQMLFWPDEFCQRLASAGFHVTRFDNRDVGRSTHFTEYGIPDFAAFLNGQPLDPPYLVEDMADDAAALLDALGLAPSHVVGASMGGMIAQALAIHHPDHVRSLTSIMSTPSTDDGPPQPEMLGLLLAPRPSTKEQYIEQHLKVFRAIGSPVFPFDDAFHRQLASDAYDRDAETTGAARQLAAILSSPDRKPGLRQLQIPALVIHGTSDPLVQPAGGEATAEAIPGAELVMEEGMGHDLPEELWDAVAGRIAALARRADGN